jgi:UMF1 family MFS transporter
MVFPKGLPRHALAWATYDFANTIYSAVVVTVYLPLYVTHLMGRNAPVGLAATASMIVAGFVTPLLGLWADRTGRAKRYLFASTLLCVLATASLSFLPRVGWMLPAFALANLLFHASLVFYNTLLPCVAPPEKQGFVSGIGTGLGYFGVLLALPVAHMVDSLWGRKWVFLLAASLFLLFSLPLFLRVPDTQATPAGRQSLKAHLKELAGNRNFVRFLAGNFFLVDALNACILWLSVFLAKVYGVTQGVLIQTLLALNFSAFLYGLIFGHVTDRMGSKKALLISLVLLALTLAGLALIPSLAWARVFILIFGGGAAAGIWTAGRKMVIDLAPEERRGEYFGFYGFTTKVSALGSLVVSVLADFFGFRVAVASQLVSLALAFWLLGGVRLKKA